MKIALVCPYDWSVAGGVGMHVEQLARQFRRLGHEATVFAPASRPEAAQPGVVTIGRPWPIPVAGTVARVAVNWPSRRVARALSQGAFDVVHLHEPLMPTLPYAFLRHSTVPVVGTFHAAREEGTRLYGWSRPLTRRWVDRLDGRIAVSPAALHLVERYFPGDYEIIPNGIDYPYWWRTREPLPELADGLRNILFVGRPEKRKGLDYLLRAFHVLRRSRDDVRLVVVGAGDFGAYERAANGDPTIVFRANVPYEELPRYHASADVMCCPNTGGESQGYVLMEALAAGVPVVASDIQGFASVVTHGVDGRLSPPRDPDALAKSLADVLDDPEGAAVLAARGRERASEYSWTRVAGRVLACYERVIQTRSGKIAEPQQPEQESVAR